MQGLRELSDATKLSLNLRFGLLAKPTLTFDARCISEKFVA